MAKASKRSAGLLMYRRCKDEIELFLVHPGGPFWAKKDRGAWTIPKGEHWAGEDALVAAQREFHEETGLIATGAFIELGSVQHKSGKIVVAWAFEGDCDPGKLVSNTCEIEWPPRSGLRLQIPEIDRGSWFSSQIARNYIRPEQTPFVDTLELKLFESDFQFSN